MSPVDIFAEFISKRILEVVHTALSVTEPSRLEIVHFAFRFTFVAGRSHGRLHSGNLFLSSVRRHIELILRGVRCFAATNIVGFHATTTTVHTVLIGNGREFSSIGTLANHFFFGELNIATLMERTTCVSVMDGIDAVISACGCTWG